MIRPLLHAGNFNTPLLEMLFIELLLVAKKMPPEDISPLVADTH
jgi:hypothetical protein